MSATDAATVAAVLAEHWEIDVDNGGDRTVYFCDGCKETLMIAGEGDVDALFRTHQAAALLAAPPIAQALAAVEERDEWHEICARQNTRLAAEETRAEIAEAAVARVEALADEMRPGLSRTPADCTDACQRGDCDCSGISRVMAWAGVSPDDLRAALRPVAGGA